MNDLQIQKLCKSSKVERFVEKVRLCSSDSLKENLIPRRDGDGNEVSGANNKGLVAQALPDL
jgi:hypothetical protein